MTPHERATLSADLALLADGDRSAFDRVFTRVWPVVHGFTVHFLGGAPDAEDAAQLALLKVFERVEGYDRTRDGLTWVLTIAAWECRTVRRRQQRRREVTLESVDDAAAHVAPPMPTVGLTSAQDTSPEVVVERRRLQLALDEALERLAPAERAILLGDLCGPDGLDLGLDGVPPATLRKRKQRALARLRAAFGLRASEP
jgi:RNA polymerase sigma-70 factor (ECF subfamily)